MSGKRKRHSPRVRYYGAAVLRVGLVPLEPLGRRDRRRLHELELRRELKAKKLPVIATGGYAELIASKLPEISAVNRDLTLEGLHLVWKAHQEEH